MNKRIRKTMISIIVLILIVIGALSPCTSTAAGADAVDALINDFQKETKCSSVSVVTYDRGELTYYGDKDGLYQIGSMTKAFTGLAVQGLIDEGKLSEDDKVSDYISGFEAFYNGKKTDITIKQLMSQTSGYTNNEKTYPSATEDMTLAQWVDSISGKELSSAPGEEYAYSNVNFNLLGAIIEDITGVSYRDYMEKEILAPLSLADTYVGTPGQKDKIIEGTRLGYRRVFKYEIPVREGAIPAGYFYSDVVDMGTWLKIWIGEEELSDTVQADSIFEKLKNEGDYYAGWERFDGDVIGHSGGTPNYSSRIVFSRNKKIGVCVLTNLNVAASTDSLCNGIYDRLSGNASNAISTDVWTVFDLVFTIISIVMIVLLIVVLLIRKKGLLIATGIILVVLMALIIILFPLIFGSDLWSIVMIWAPWSLAGGLILMAVDIMAVLIRSIFGKWKKA